MAMPNQPEATKSQVGVQLWRKSYKAWNSSFFSPGSFLFPFLSLLFILYQSFMFPPPPSFPFISIISIGSNHCTFASYLCLSQKYQPGHCQHRLMQMRESDGGCNPRSTQASPSAAQAWIRFVFSWLLLLSVYLDLGKNGCHCSARSGPCSVHLNKRQPTLRCANCVLVFKCILVLCSLSVMVLFARFSAQRQWIIEMEWIG